jgi:GNAT superfamily N-acetyltransferase
MLGKWMASVLHLRKQLVLPPVALPVPGARLRTFEIPEDVSRWLALRDRAMSNQLPAVRSWNESDFYVEMVNKLWWRAECTWVACDVNRPLGGLIGAVTLAMRKGKAASVPVVHWLLVDPASRRRGVGRMLMSQLERAAWDVGWRELQLETHAGWSAAVAFYQSMGYAPLGERSPR